MRWYLIRRMVGSNAFRKISPFVIAVSSYFAGALAPEYCRRLIDSLFYRNSPVSESSFKDPAGLNIETRINKKGEREAYLCHRASGSSRRISQDMSTEGLEEIAGEAESLNITPDINPLYDR